MLNSIQNSIVSPFGVYLSSAISVGSFISMYFSANGIAWGIGCTAGIVAIITGILTWQEKNVSIKIKHIQLGKLIKEIEDKTEDDDDEID